MHLAKHFLKLEWGVTHNTQHLWGAEQMMHLASKGVSGNYEMHQTMCSVLILFHFRTEIV